MSACAVGEAPDADHISSLLQARVAPSGAQAKVQTLLVCLTRTAAITRVVHDGRHLRQADVVDCGASLLPDARVVSGVQASAQTVLVGAPSRTVSA